jgi:catechol 2,3-dioxygenase
MENKFKLGHVHLKVVDLDRAINFYSQLLGFRVTERVGTYCFLTYGDAHHELAIHSIRGEPTFPDKRSVGLYHFAIEVPSFDDFKRVYKLLRQSGVAVRPIDQGISKALYFDDPDGNGVEVFVDTRTESSCFEWQGKSSDILETELL